MSTDPALLDAQQQQQQHPAVAVGGAPYDTTRTRSATPPPRNKVLDAGLVVGAVHKVRSKFGVWKSHIPTAAPPVPTPQETLPAAVGPDVYSDNEKVEPERDRVLPLPTSTTSSAASRYYIPEHLLASSSSSSSQKQSDTTHTANSSSNNNNNNNIHPLIAAILQNRSNPNTTAAETTTTTPLPGVASAVTTAEASSSLSSQPAIAELVEQRDGQQSAAVTPLATAVLSSQSVVISPKATAAVAGGGDAASATAVLSHNVVSPEAAAGDDTETTTTTAAATTTVPISSMRPPRNIFAAPSDASSVGTDFNNKDYSSPRTANAAAAAVVVELPHQQQYTVSTPAERLQRKQAIVRRNQQYKHFLQRLERLMQVVRTDHQQQLARITARRETLKELGAWVEDSPLETTTDFLSVVCTETDRLLSSYSENYESNIVEMVVQWNASVVDQLRAEIVSAKKIYSTLDHYEDKVVGLQQKFSRQPTGTDAAQNLWIKLERNQHKLQDAAAAYAECCDRLERLDKTISHDWMLIFPLLVNLLQGDLDEAKERASTMELLKDSLCEMSEAVQRHGLDPHVTSSTLEIWSYLYTRGAASAYNFESAAVGEAGVAADASANSESTELDNDKVHHTARAAASEEHASLGSLGYQHQQQLDTEQSSTNQLQQTMQSSDGDERVAPEKSSQAARGTVVLGEFSMPTAELIDIDDDDPHHQQQRRPVDPSMIGIKDEIPPGTGSGQVELSKPTSIGIGNAQAAVANTVDLIDNGGGNPQHHKQRRPRDPSVIVIRNEIPPADDQIESAMPATLGTTNTPVDNEKPVAIINNDIGHPNNQERPWRNAFVVNPSQRIGEAEHHPPPISLPSIDTVGDEVGTSGDDFREDQIDSQAANKFADTSSEPNPEVNAVNEVVTNQFTSTIDATATMDGKDSGIGHYPSPSKEEKSEESVQQEKSANADVASLDTSTAHDAYIGSTINNMDSGSSPQLQHGYRDLSERGNAIDPTDQEISVTPFAVVNLVDPSMSTTLGSSNAQNTYTSPMSSTNGRSPPPQHESPEHQHQSHIDEAVEEIDEFLTNVYAVEPTVNKTENGNEHFLEEARENVSEELCDSNAEVAGECSTKEVFTPKRGVDPPDDDASIRYTYESDDDEPELSPRRSTEPELVHHHPASSDPEQLDSPLVDLRPDCNLFAASEPGDGIDAEVNEKNEFEQDLAASATDEGVHFLSQPQAHVDADADDYADVLDAAALVDGCDSGSFYHSIIEHVDEVSGGPQGYMC